MTYNLKEILKKYKTRYNLNKALDAKEIYKIDHNVYSESEMVNPMVIVSKKYKNSIISMNSAFFYYNLTDVIPQKTYIATNRNSNVIDDERIVQIKIPKEIKIKIPKEILNNGKTCVTIDGMTVNIYDKERLLVELIRNEKKIPFDYYKEIINNYRKIVDELDMYKLEEYISLYKNSNKINDKILREVF